MSRTTLWTALSCIAAPSRRQSAPKFALRPGAEGLEDRKLMAVLTELADVALQVGHTNPGTHLYINFDGGMAPTDFTGKNFVTIRPFETEAGDTGLNRDRDIQDILFQVAEVYSPFDVQVERISDAGAYSTNGGDTTVFVGGNEANSVGKIDGVGLETVTYTKIATSFTPGAFDDGQTVGHVINTHPYDVAFVDPVKGVTTDQASIIKSYSTETQAGDPTRADIFDIRRSIAHEAGHTFGLEHVRTDGIPDSKDLGKGTVEDVQAYGARNVFFANQSLPLTKANNTLNDGVKFDSTLPAYHDSATNQDVTLKTENSYQTLGRVLGYRLRNESLPLVSDIGTVDPIAHRVPVNESSASRIDGYFGRNGDYQVFTYKPADTAVRLLGFDKISVRATSGDLRPEILVYDASGINLISVVKPSAGVATLTTLKAGTTYIIVIGAVDGQTRGDYITTIDHHSIVTDKVSDTPNTVHVDLGLGVHTTVTSTVDTVGLSTTPGVHTGITSTVTSVGLVDTVNLPAATTSTTLDLALIYVDSPTLGLTLVEQPVFVKPLKRLGPIVATTIPVAVPASDLTVVVDTTVADSSGTVVAADTSTTPIAEPPVDTSAGPGLVAMATDAALDSLASPALDALALAQVIDGTSLLDPNVTSVPSGV